MVWSDTYNRKLAQGHDHGSAAYEADMAEKRAAKQRSKRQVRLRNLGDKMIVEIDGQEVINTHCPTIETAIDEIASF